MCSQQHGTTGDHSHGRSLGLGWIVRHYQPTAVRQRLTSRAWMSPPSLMDQSVAKPTSSSTEVGSPLLHESGHRTSAPMGAQETRVAGVAAPDVRASDASRSWPVRSCAPILAFGRPGADDAQDPNTGAEAYRRSWAFLTAASARQKADRVCRAGPTPLQHSGSACYVRRSPS